MTRPATLKEAKARWRYWTRRVLSDDAMRCAKQKIAWSIDDRGFPVVSLGNPVSFRFRFGHGEFGGIHATLKGDIQMDALAAKLGLKRGQSYPLDLFFTERHTGGSSFRVTTSLQFTNCEPILR